MLTPQEVSTKAFPKSSFASSGYQMAAVDEFLDTLTEDYTSLYKENAALKSKLKVLAEKIEEYRATEDAMRSTLLTAQRMASKLVEEAEAEKAQILEKAQADAADRIAELNEQTRQAEERLEQGRRSLGDFLIRAREICAQQADFLTKLPEMPVDKSAPVIPAEPVSEPTIVAEDPTVVVEPTPAEPEPEEEPAPAEPEVPTGDTAVFPRDFKLSLDQLKFGKNYNDGQNG
ncbi:MAG: DivIVA domain-containing protein [Oscillospiraceae bacterium]|nr:DivIVA domain-containing protein [Oscillospiraceae bacterium]